MVAVTTEDRIIGHFLQTTGPNVSYGAFFRAERQISVEPVASIMIVHGITPYHWTQRGYQNYSDAILIKDKKRRYMRKYHLYESRNLGKTTSSKCFA